MEVLDESKLNVLKEIERIMESKSYDEELTFFGMGTQGRIYVTKDWKCAVKFYHQEEDIEEIEECSWQFEADGDYAIDPEESFKNEVTAMKLLNEAGCPYIPKLYGYKENRYVVKEFVSGSNYEEYCTLNGLECLDEGEEPSERRLQFLFKYNKQMDEFKALCEKINIIPADCTYKPNVIIDDDESIMIVDLGHFKIV